MIVVRTEAPQDLPAIRRINELAFGRPNEAALVDALRHAACPFLSLVAVADTRAVGHILFTPVTIDGSDAISTGLGLAPMAVLPDHQRTGVGSQLVREGLRACVRQGYAVVVVLGHPAYYPRVGFVPAAGKGLRCEYPVPDEVFMVAELVPGALQGRTGLVKYRPELAAV